MNNLIYRTSVGVLKGALLLSVSLPSHAALEEIVVVAQKMRAEFTRCSRCSYSTKWSPVN